MKKHPDYHTDPMDSHHQVLNELNENVSATNLEGLDRAFEEEIIQPVSGQNSENIEDIKVIKEELAAAQEKINQYLKHLADAENTSHRIKRDAERDVKFALERFVGDLLPAYDSLERGVAEIAAGNGSLESLQKGTELTLTMLLKVLNKHNVNQIDPLGELFNPALHEAVSVVSLPDAKPNTIHQVLQKGYLLNGRLVRPAMVIVTKA